MTHEQNIDARLARMEASLRHIQEDVQEAKKQRKEDSDKMSALVLAEAERKGREAVERKDESYRHDDRWQVWVRALVPTAILTAAFNALLALFSIGGGE